VTKDFKPLAHRHPLNAQYLLDKSLQIIAPFLHQRPYDLHFLLATVAEIKEQMQRLPEDFPYWGVCWGDPHSGNVHINADDRMTLFDFDQCGYGWRAFDIAKFLQVSLGSGLSRSVRRAFLQGYDQATPLSNVECSALQFLTQAAYIWSWSISLNNTILNDYSRLDHHYFSHRLEGLKRLTSSDWELF
jgi:Ser/Thr protein kinase RdoA (MazF antagonist)